MGLRNEVKIFGDVAYDLAHFTTTLTPKAGGEAITMKGRVFEIGKKEIGAWKSLRVMVNSEEAPLRRVPPR